MPTLAVIRTCRRRRRRPRTARPGRRAAGRPRPRARPDRRRPRAGRRTRRRRAGRRCRSGRSVRRSRSATAISSSSPAVWPEPSLTALKSSRSTNSTATGAASAVGAGERVLQPVGEQRAVGQAGQRVVEGVVLELGLQLLLLRHVAGGDDDRPDVGIVEQVGVDALHVPVAAVLVPQPQVGRSSGAGAGDGLAARGQQGEPVLGVGQVGQLRADQLVLGVAEQPGDRGRLVADGQVGVDQRDQVRGVVHQRLEPRLALRLRGRDAQLTGAAGGLEPAEQQPGHEGREDHHEQRLEVGDPAGGEVGLAVLGGRLGDGVVQRGGGAVPAPAARRRARPAAPAPRDPLGGVAEGAPRRRPASSASPSADTTTRRAASSTRLAASARRRRTGAARMTRHSRAPARRRRRPLGEQDVGPGAGVGLVPQRHDAETHAQGDVEGEDDHEPAAPAPRGAGQASAAAGPRARPDHATVRSSDRDAPRRSSSADRMDGIRRCSGSDRRPRPATEEPAALSLAR